MTLPSTVPHLARLPSASCTLTKPDSVSSLAGWSSMVAALCMRGGGGVCALRGWVGGGGSAHVSQNVSQYRDLRTRTTHTPNEYATIPLIRQVVCVGAQSIAPWQPANAQPPPTRCALHHATPPLAPCPVNNAMQRAAQPQNAAGHTISHTRTLWRVAACARRAQQLRGFPTTAALGCCRLLERSSFKHVRWYRY